MMTSEYILNGGMDAALAALYPQPQIESQRTRYADILAQFRAQFGEGEPEFFSAPGRTEVGGNHTDHNHGRVLAAGVQLDAVAAAVRRERRRRAAEVGRRDSCAVRRRKRALRRRPET